MKLLKRLLLFVIILIVVYNIWAATGRVKNTDGIKITSLTKEPITSVGIDSGRGNVIGLQPLLNAASYSSKESLLQSLLPYFSLAKEKRILNDKTIVVLPEYTGSWLVAANEKKSVYREAYIMDAMQTMVISNIFKFVWTYFTAPASSNKSTYAVFAMKGKEMAEIYQDVFSTLAKEFNVTIVAGSIVLPEPSINKEGKLTAGKGSLYNTSAIFDNKGNLVSPLVKKIYPVDEEAGFTACGIETQKPVFNTPAGNLGVLVCADSWYPAAYQSFNEDIKIIAVPSLGGTDDIWNAPWNGYNGFKAPGDVDTMDYKKLTEGEAWEKYSMGPRSVKAGVHYGMNVFFTGQLWDKKSEGRVLVLNKDSLTVYPPATFGRIVNLWLN